MSTDYDVTLTASDGSTAKIQIIDSINPLPFSDTWTGVESELGSAGGKVASWGTDNAILHTGLGAASAITLDNFSKTITAGDTGTGSKITLAGTFPDGDLEWRCDKVD
jgi:hypothetical protein